MSPYHKKQKEKRRKNLFRKWHRRIGFAAALFLVNLAVTGILLNHSESLALHKKYVSSDWLTDWYGISAPNQAICFKTNLIDKPICQLGEKRFLGHNILEHNTPELVGVTQLEGLFYVAGINRLSLYTQEWSLIETVEAKDGLPTPVSAIGILETLPKTERSTSLVILSEQQGYHFDSDTLTWDPSEIDIDKFIKSQPIISDTVGTLKPIYLDHQISYLKLLQDLHSGRILHTPGKWLTDIAAITVILLALSGFLAWQNRTKGLG